MSAPAEEEPKPVDTFDVLREQMIVDARASNYEHSHDEFVSMYQTIRVLDNEHWQELVVESIEKTFRNVLRWYQWQRQEQVRTGREIPIPSWVKRLSTGSKM